MSEAKDEKVKGQTGNPGLNDEIERAVHNQGSVKPEDYPDVAVSVPAPKKS